MKIKELVSVANKVHGWDKKTRSNAAKVLGTIGGKAKSERKTLAARRNAKRGGWPKGRKRKVK